MYQNQHQSGLRKSASNYKTYDITSFEGSYPQRQQYDSFPFKSTSRLTGNSVIQWRASNWQFETLLWQSELMFALINHQSCEIMISYLKLKSIKNYLSTTI